MRRITIGLTIIFALSLLLTAIATAAPPKCEQLPFEHPHYCGPPPSNTTTSTTTTTVPEPSTLESCPTDTFTIEVPGPGRVTFECLWTPEGPVAAPVEGTATISPSGRVSQLTVMVLDSYPGDICVVEQEWDGQDGPDFVASFLLSYADLDDDLYPDSAPYEDKTYWSFGGTNWCYPQDPVPGAPPEVREDLNGKPLHLYVDFVAKKNATVNVALYPEQVEAP